MLMKYVIKSLFLTQFADLFLLYITFLDILRNMCFSTTVLYGYILIKFYSSFFELKNYYDLKLILAILYPQISVI